MLIGNLTNAEGTKDEKVIFQMDFKEGKLLVEICEEWLKTQNKRKSLKKQLATNLRNLECF